MLEVADLGTLDSVLPLDKQPADAGGRERDFNPTAVVVLRKRIRQAINAGSANVVIDVRLLDELLSASGEAMKHGFQSQYKL